MDVLMSTIAVPAASARPRPPRFLAQDRKQLRREYVRRRRCGCGRRGGSFTGGLRVACFILRLRRPLSAT
jgi:hypothetical protein